MTQQFSNMNTLLLIASHTPTPSEKKKRVYKMVGWQVQKKALKTLHLQSLPGVQPPTLKLFASFFFSLLFVCSSFAVAIRLLELSQHSTPSNTKQVNKF